MPSILEVFNVNGELKDDPLNTLPTPPPGQSYSSCGLIDDLINNQGYHQVFANARIKAGAKETEKAGKAF